MTRVFHKIWIDSGGAAGDIREAFGLQMVLSYLIAEKFLDFLRAAGQDTNFAGKVPSFVAAIKRIFDPADLRVYFDGVCCIGRLAQTASDEADEEMLEAGVLDEDPVEWAENVLSIERAKKLLLT